MGESAETHNEKWALLGFSLRAALAFMAGLSDLGQFLSWGPYDSPLLTAIDLRDVGTAIVPALLTDEQRPIQSACDDSVLFPNAFRSGASLLKASLDSKSSVVHRCDVIAPVTNASACARSAPLLHLCSATWRWFLGLTCPCRFLRWHLLRLLVCLSARSPLLRCCPRLRK